MPDESRVATLKEVLTANPDDTFARYALGYGILRLRRHGNRAG